MNIKYASLLLLLGFGIATAGCGECFPDKSLEELEAMRKELMEKEGITRNFGHRQCRAVSFEYYKSQAKLATARLSCRIYTDFPKAAYLLGATQNDCDLIGQYTEEYWELDELRDYTKKKLKKIKSPELKAVEKCVMERKATKILEKSGSL